MPDRQGYAHLPCVAFFGKFPPARMTPHHAMLEQKPSPLGSLTRAVEIQRQHTSHGERNPHRQVDLGENNLEAVRGRCGAGAGLRGAFSFIRIHVSRLCVFV